MNRLPSVLVRPAVRWGWEWNVGHSCSYVCGAGGCDGAGWRPTRRWAVKAGRAYRKRLERHAQQREWQIPEQGR